MRDGTDNHGIQAALGLRPEPGIQLSLRIRFRFRLPSRVGERRRPVQASAAPLKEPEWNPRLHTFRQRPYGAQDFGDRLIPWTD